VLGVGLVLAPAPAAAVAVDRSELRSLLARAAEDPKALAALRSVTAVDGVPVDVRGALAGARDEPTLAARLETLASGLPASAPGAATPAASDREAARRILAERRFQEVDRPRPLRRPLAWLADRIRVAGDALEDLASALPGGRATLVALAALVLAVLVAVFVAPLLGRRGARTAEAEASRAAAGVDPRALEREAEAAEARGELERALRLRFRAGLARLALQRRVAREASLTSAELSRRLASPRFDELARTFDEVVYGGRPARPEEVEAARQGWPRVLEEAAPTGTGRER
jgi:hypothetical protein